MTSCAIQSLYLVGLVTRLLKIIVARVPGKHFAICGMRDEAAKGARGRVLAALGRVAVNPADLMGIQLVLEPGAVRPHGIDLALAVAALVALGKVAPPAPREAFVGELAFDGRLRPIRGVLPLLRGAGALGITHVMLPMGNKVEAGEASEQGFYAHPLAAIGDVLDQLRGGEVLMPPRPAAFAPTFGTVDLADARGLEGAKRALEVAAAGGHSIAFIGSDSAAKFGLAKGLISILPGMTRDEALEVGSVFSVAGLLHDGQLPTQRPWRAPHFTVSTGGMIITGEPPRPGEVSLASGGVLYLDDAASFRRATLDAVFASVGPKGIVSSFHIEEQVTFPSAAHLVIGLDPPTATNAEHVNRILENVDIVVQLPEGKAMGKAGEASATIRERVVAARARRVVQGDQRGVSLDGEARQIYATIVDRTDRNGRARDAALRIAQTIAALNGINVIRGACLTEAIALAGFSAAVGAA